MFFFLSKILDYALNPFLWIIALFVFVLFSKSQKFKPKAFLAGFVLLIFFGNGFIVSEAFRIWEKPSVPFSSITSKQTAIVLSGVINPKRKSPDRVYFDKGADRLLHTVQLYKEGKIGHVLITGGSGMLNGAKVSEAEELKSVFLYCGVPDSVLIIEDKSRNTRENAVFSKRMLDSLNLDSNLLLVTSAFHMRRAEACFNKVGLQPTIFPVDFYASDRSFSFDNLFIPSENSLKKWAILIHEVAGFIIYKISGYC